LRGSLREDRRVSPEPLERNLWSQINSERKNQRREGEGVRGMREGEGVREGDGMREGGDEKGRGDEREGWDGEGIRVGGGDERGKGGERERA
jgi:hypothetical protein